MSGEATKGSYGTIHATLRPGLKPGDECAGCGEPLELKEGAVIEDGELLCDTCKGGQNP